MQYNVDRPILFKGIKKEDEERIVYYHMIIIRYRYEKEKMPVGSRRFHNDAEDEEEGDF